MQEMSGAWYVFDLWGTAVFAFTGALAAGNRGMDVFGMAVVALVTATGGGTLRDLLLGRRVFWIDDPQYLTVSTLTALAVFLLMRRGIGEGSRLLVVADALGLGIFTVIGADKALHAGCSWGIVVFMATLTGTGGGITRDILCGREPVVLHREVYALTALAGAALFLLLHRLGISAETNAACVVAAVFATRLLCRWRNLHLRRESGQSRGHAV